MPLPPLAERRLVLAIVCGLAVVMTGIVVLLPGPHPAQDSPGADAPPPSSARPGAGAPSPGPAAPTTGAGPAATAAPGTPGSGPAGTAPAPGSTTGPTGVPGAPPGSAPGGAQTRGPGPSDTGPAGTASAAPGQQPAPPRGPSPPPPLVDELPAPVSAVDRLVPGFPDVLVPPAGSQVKVSGLSTEGDHAEVSLVASTTDAPATVVGHYRHRLADVGFAEARLVDAGVESTAVFARGPESVVVTASVGSFSLYASVVPDPAPRPETGTAPLELPGGAAPQLDRQQAPGEPGPATTPGPTPEPTATPAP